MTCRSSPRQLLTRPALLALLLLLLAWPQTASATNYPWCALSMEVGTPICGYESYEQCRMSARSCIRNPALPVEPLPSPPGRPAQRRR